MLIVVYYNGDPAVSKPPMMDCKSPAILNYYIVVYMDLVLVIQLKHDQHSGGTSMNQMSCIVWADQKLLKHMEHVAASFA